MDDASISIYQAMLDRISRPEHDLVLSYRQFQDLVITDGFTRDEDTRVEVTRHIENIENEDRVWPINLLRFLLDYKKGEIDHATFSLGINNLSSWFENVPNGWSRVLTFMNRESFDLLEDEFVMLSGYPGAYASDREEDEDIDRVEDEDSPVKADLDRPKKRVARELFGEPEADDDDEEVCDRSKKRRKVEATFKMTNEGATLKGDSEGIPILVKMQKQDNAHKENMLKETNALENKRLLQDDKKHERTMAFEDKKLEQDGELEKMRIKATVQIAAMQSHSQSTPGSHHSTPFSPAYGHFSPQPYGGQTIPGHPPPFQFTSPHNSGGQNIPGFLSPRVSYNPFAASSTIPQTNATMPIDLQGQIPPIYRNSGMPPSHQSAAFLSPMKAAQMPTSSGLALVTHSTSSQNDDSQYTTFATVDLQGDEIWPTSRMITESGVPLCRVWKPNGFHEWQQTGSGNKKAIFVECSCTKKNPQDGIHARLRLKKNKEGDKKVEIQYDNENRNLCVHVGGALVYY